MHTHTHTHVYKRIDVQIHTHMHIYTYIHVRTHTHIHIYAHTHTKCTYETHASTPGTTARQRTCKEPLQTKEALRFSFVRRNQTTVRTSNARTTLYPRPAALIPLHPPSSLPNIPQNSSKLAQLHNGPLRSCRKTRGKAAVQQSCSKRSTQESKPENDQGDCSRRNERSMKKTTKPCNSPHTITTARRTGNIPLICTGAGPIHPVHSQPMSLATEAMPEWGYISAILPPSCTEPLALRTHTCIHTRSRLRVHKRSDLMLYVGQKECVLLAFSVRGNLRTVRELPYT